MSDFRNSLEEYVVEQLKDVDSDTRKTPGSGCGASLGDVSNKYFYVECLAGDAIITKHSGGKRSKRITIKEAYEYLTDPTLSGSGYSSSQYKNKAGILKIKKYPNRTSWWKRTQLPSIYCLNTETDKITINRMKNIICSGKKQVFELKTRLGFKIKSTSTHLFFSSKGWVPLKKLKINDCVAVKNWNEYRYQNRHQPRKEINLFKKLKANNKCEFCDEANNLEIHHKDSNFKNNCLSNLQVLCCSCHRRLPRKRRKHIYENYEFDKIISINKIGKEICYDIEMEGKDNLANFIANEFIVHNCKQKHTRANIIIDYKKEYMDLVGQMPLNTKKIAIIVTENKYGDKFATLDADDFFDIAREAKCKP